MGKVNNDEEAGKVMRRGFAAVILPPSRRAAAPYRNAPECGG